MASKVLTEAEVEQKWTESAVQRLVGHTIKSVRYMTSTEISDLGWYKRPLVVELSNGTLLFPQMDDEGNDGGVLAGNDAEGNELVFPVLTS